MATPNGTAFPSALPLTATLLPTFTSTPPPTPTATPTPDAQLVQAEYALLEGNWSAAEAGFRAALAAGGDASRASYGIARTLYARGDYAGTVDTLNQLIASQPPEEYKLRADFLLGEAQAAQKQWDAAAAAYQGAILLGPGPIDAILEEHSGDALLSGGHMDQAVQSFAAAAIAATADDRPRLTEKEADAVRTAGSNEAALQLYDSLIPQVTTDTDRARLQRKAGLVLIDLKRETDAYQRYQTAMQYPGAYDAYLCLSDLVDAGQTVDEYQRGLIDFYAGQSNPAVAAFTRFLSTSPSNPGPALYRRGLAYSALGQTDDALQDLRAVIALGPSSGVWEAATFDAASIEESDKADVAAGWQTLVAFADGAPNNPRAAEALDQAARIAERGNDLAKAAELWKRVADSYPASSLAPDARHLSGISLYRTGDYNGAETAFQALANSADPETLARAWFWVAKTKLASGDSAGSGQALDQAAKSDPTGYYSQHASDLRAGRAPFYAPASSNFDFDLDAEYAQAVDWVRQQKVPSTTPTPPQDDSPARNDPRLARGRLLWDLGLYAGAEADFTSLRNSVAANPIALLYLSQYFQQIGYYPGAIYAARQTLDAIGVQGTATFSAPSYFNHIRFGPYFRDLIIPAGNATSLDPLLLFAVVRVESALFDVHASSSSGALGLMQLMPATAQDVAKRKGLGDLSRTEISRPVVNIQLGTSYLAIQRDSFGGDLALALAAYNGGPGNAADWQALSNGDDDLLMEVIRFSETRLYIRTIYEYEALYRSFYGT